MILVAAADAKGASATSDPPDAPNGAIREQNQSNQPSKTTLTQPSASLEEIVVTATRREESISKVPISIMALSQDDLDQKGIRDFSEMVRFTPGVSIDTSGTNAIAIRGITASGGAGTTGIYIDDTPIQMRSLGYVPDDTLPKTFDLDRVEVLRGPQGTLFGAGSEGGTVRYIMTQPSVTTESTYARTELSYTQYGEPSYEAGIAHGAPLIDGVLGVRASVWYRYDGGWINRVDEDTGAITQSNANYAGTVAMRLAFLWQPADNIKITPSIAYQSKHQHDFSTYWPAYSNPSAGEFNNATPERIPVPDLYYLPAVKIQVDFARTTLISNSSYYHRDEQDSYQGTAYDLAYYESLGWPALGCGPTSKTSTEPCSWYPLINATGVHLPPQFADYQTPNTINNYQRTWTQEVRLQSTDEGRVKWTVGLFGSLAQERSLEQLFDTQINQFFAYLYGPAITPNTYFGPYYTCAGAPGSTVQPAQFPMPNCAIYYNNNVSFDRQIAGFGELTYKVNDQLSITAGGRYAKLGFSVDHYSNGYENGGPSEDGGSEHESAFTPKLGLNYQADNHNLFYFTYAKGFRPGGYNPPLPPACAQGLIAEGYSSGQSPLSYNSDSTQSYEIGSKNNFNDRVKIASSVYYILWKGIQQSVIPGDCGFQFTDNVGAAVSKGFDLQADALIGGGLSMEVAVGYTDARFSKTSIGNVVVAGDAISGNAATNYSPGTSAPWNIAVGPQYDFHVAERDAFVRLDWEYSSRNPWLAPLQDPASTQFSPNSTTLPATSFASLRGGMKFGNWQVSAFVDNLFDSHTVLNYARDVPDESNPSYNPNLPSSVQENDFTYRPRTFGVTVTFRQ